MFKSSATGTMRGCTRQSRCTINGLSRVSRQKVLFSGKNLESCLLSPSESLSTKSSSLQRQANMIHAEMIESIRNDDLTRPIKYLISDRIKQRNESMSTTSSPPLPFNSIYRDLLFLALSELNDKDGKSFDLGTRLDSVLVANKILILLLSLCQTTSTSNTASLTDSYRTRIRTLFYRTMVHRLWVQYFVAICSSNLDWVALQRLSLIEHASLANIVVFFFLQNKPLHPLLP